MIQSKAKQKLTYSSISKKPIAPDSRKRVTVTKCFQPTRRNDDNSDLPEIQWFYDPELPLFNKQCSDLTGGAGPHDGIINIVKSPTCTINSQRGMGRRIENKSITRKMSFRKQIKRAVEQKSTSSSEKMVCCKQPKTGTLTKTTRIKSKIPSKQKVIRPAVKDVDIVSNIDIQLSGENVAEMAQQDELLKYVEDLKKEIKLSQLAPKSYTSIMSVENSVVDELRKEIDNEKRKNFEHFQKQVTDLKNEIEYFRTIQQSLRKDQAVSSHEFRREFQDAECNTSLPLDPPHQGETMRFPDVGVQGSSRVVDNYERCCPAVCNCFRQNEIEEGEQVAMSKIQEANVLIDRVKTTLNQLQNASGIRDACNTRNEAGNYLNSVPDKVEVSTNTSGEIYVKDKETTNVSVNTENINCISKELQVDRVDLSSQEKAAAVSIEEVLVSPLFKETKNDFNEDVDENCKNVVKSDEETDTEEPLKEEPLPCRKFCHKSTKFLEDTISFDQASIGSEFIIDYQSLMKDTDPRPKTRRKPDCHASRSGETLTSIESNCDCPFDPVMEYVHSKLQAISENSENDSNSEEKALDDEEANKLVHETNKILDGKPMPLSIQQMPSINIPGSLVLQPTLNLSINSEGVAKNNLPNKSNISYGEVLVNGKVKQRQPPASEEVKSLPSLSSKTRIPKVTLDDSVSTSTPKIEMKDPTEVLTDTTESVMVEIKPLDESNLFELTFSSVNLAKSNTEIASSSAISTEQYTGDKESEMQSDVTKDEVSLSTEAPGVDKALQSVKSTEICEKPPKGTSTFNVTPNEDEDCVVVYRSYHILPQNRAVSIQRNYHIKVSSATKLKKDNLAFYRTFINPLTSSSSDSCSVHDEQDGTIKIQSKTDSPQHLVHPVTKLETYGFLRTAATQCDLSKENVVEQSDTRNSTPPISAEVQSNANKNSDESVELVIKLESNSTELCTDFAKQFDLKEDKMLVKQIVEMKHPVKECSPTSSGRNSTSNQTYTDEFSSGRISGRRVKVKKVFQPLCLDNYEIKNRSIGISPRIPSRRSRLKHLTDTSATESLSEGEIRCCNTSMGEVHKHPKDVSRQNKSVFVKKFPKIYSIENSNVQVEQHRHYFNNWVTYYVSSKNREYVNDTSSTSSSYK